MPDYGAILSDQQIWELVRFLKVNAIDWRNLYDLTTTGSYPTGAAIFAAIGKDGDAARGDAIFAANCAYCHGANGAYIKVDGAAYTVGRHVRAKPYEDQHKVRFGQLGSAMLPTALTLQQLTDLYKALTNNTKYPD
jgi:mono/diheme cytochrome c family protein